MSENKPCWYIAGQEEAGCLGWAHTHMTICPNCGDRDGCRCPPKAEGTKTPVIHKIVEIQTVKLPQGGAVIYALLDDGGLLAPFASVGAPPAFENEITGCREA
jgi:hypothetical protein